MTDVLSKWVTDYRAAWDSNDPDDIAALFTEDAVYYNEPFTAPSRGREAIVQNWLDNADQPGDTTFEWKPVVETDEVGIVQGVTSYPHTIYSNLWVIRFDDDGRATEFTDWWMEQGKPEEADERE
jgi:ketosteroid isomerase-like protein